MFKKPIALALLVAVIPLFAVARQEPARPAIASETPAKEMRNAAPAVEKPFPFRVGETLFYEVSFSRLIFSGSIGQLELTVNKPKDSENRRLELHAEAVSKGFFPRLFGVRVRDRYMATVDSDDLGLYVASRVISQGNVHREQKSLIDRESGRVTYVDRDLNNADAEPKVEEAESPTWIQDVLSVCYFIRTQKLVEGRTITVPLSDTGKVYNIDVIVGGREQIKVDAGTFNAIKLDPKIFDGKFVRRSGEMIIWISDDPLRIPVKARIKTQGVTVNVDLKSIRFDDPSTKPAGGNVES